MLIFYILFKIFQDILRREVVKVILCTEVPSVVFNQLDILLESGTKHTHPKRFQNSTATKELEFFTYLPIFCCKRRQFRKGKC